MHGLRQAHPEEEGELTPTTVHLVCGTGPLSSSQTSDPFVQRAN